MNALTHFQPGIRDWFEERFTRPTNVQAKSWPLIADGKHVLITAPTGSGKTLTAFLWSLNQFASHEWEPGRTRVIYVSPLKALNNDIQRNLLGPLGELRKNHNFPAISVQTRSGDTSQGDRQRMLRRPPDVLITTPESLSLLLTTSKGRQALSTVETVILDEIHAIVDNRRGVQLMTSIERLAHIAGEFQRLALSATIRPLEAVASYVGGYLPDGSPRSLEIVSCEDDKKIQFRVRFPEEAKHAVENGKKIWDPLADSFRDVIDHNRATLFFTNSRRLAEKITLKINEDQPVPLAYAHHGSLARDIRIEVESRLKAGELRAIVATNSLEMGIDIGHLDEVVMVQSPPSVASALQRIGRAGHQVGETSIGTLYPTHAQDFLEAAVLANTIAERDIEPLVPLENALDVLAQIIVSMCANETWAVQELFALIRRSAPYHRLPREHFDLVLDMLAGRYAGSRVRELKLRIVYDRINQTVKAQKSAVFALYNSGGTIPDRGYYTLRHANTGAMLGDLDEEFVWEATTGQTFTLGTQNWQIQRITHNDVMVTPGRAGSTAPPFWRSENFNRSFHFSERINQYLELAESAFTEGREEKLKADLIDQRGFEETAATELIDYLARQRSSSGTALPHRHHVLIELVHTGPGGYHGPDGERQVVIHTFWGGRLNRPWALALDAAWRKKFDGEPEIHADNNAVVIQLKSNPDPALITTLVTPENLLALLRKSLEGSGLFGARFRECAGRSLLITRQRFNQRLPLWMSRLQAKKLMTATAKYTDFPVLLETWRTCLNDEFDLDALSRMLGELQSGEISWTFVNTTTPSPFASNITFDQINRYMYADDTPERRQPSALDEDLIRSAIHDASLRPKLLPETVDEFLAKRQRTAKGYQPQTEEEWLEWLKERVLIPESEFVDAFEHVHVARLTLGGRSWVTHRELLSGLIQSGFCHDAEVSGFVPEVDDPRTAEQYAMEILSFYGPLSEDHIKTLLPSVPDGLLEDREQLIYGALLKNDDTELYCDTENFEALLRFQRARQRPEVTARPVTELPVFLMAWQGFARTLDDQTMIEVLEQLRGYAAPVSTWLDDLLAARFTEFADYHLDQAFTQQQLNWLGVASEQITIGYPEDLELMRVLKEPAELATYFADPNARYGFFQIADLTDEGLVAFSERWWQSVWRGELSADSLAPIRQGQARKFSLSEPARTTHRASHRERRRARSLAQGWSGNWSLNTVAEDVPDALTELEDNKERARLLLDRYGFVCRELANREGGTMRWRNLFKALRIMELSGEVVTGYFFSELSGPQFITPRALHHFQQNNTPNDYLWMSALDPASPCGMSLPWEALPQRRAQNYLAFYKGELALIVENSGKRLTFLLPADHPELDGLCALLVHLARRLKRLNVETINGQPARQSPYLEPLGRVLTCSRDHKQVYLHAK
ncbi:MAG: DEAD/DEAH box helicase [Gammaproteobacteria bacterium]|nr:MAG: DEAD/DEAH box helicase [Gammaproteobacteria bacterium]